MLLVGQRLHISHDHHLIRSWGIRHAKQFDVDEVLYQHCVKKLLVGYLKFRRPMDSVVLRRLQLINQCYENLIWEITQMFVAGRLGRLDPLKPLWLLLDSRVVDVPMAYNPIVVTLSSLKPFFFNGLQSGGALLGPWWSIRPRNPIRASEFCGYPQPLHALPRIR